MKEFVEAFVEKAQEEQDKSDTPLLPDGKGNCTGENGGVSLNALVVQDYNTGQLATQEHRGVTVSDEHEDNKLLDFANLDPTPTDPHLYIVQETALVDEHRPVHDHISHKHSTHRLPNTPVEHENGTLENVAPQATRFYHGRSELTPWQQAKADGQKRMGLQPLSARSGRPTAPASVFHVGDLGDGNIARSQRAREALPQGSSSPILDTPQRDLLPSTTGNGGEEITADYKVLPNE